MSRGVNRVILLGRLGKDPEIRHSNSGAAIANITLATSDGYKDKQTGETVDRTEWHRIVFFNKLAEIVQQYLKKGAQIYLEGKLQTRKWQDKEGQYRWTTEIVASEMNMVGSNGGNNDPGYAEEQKKDYGQASAPREAASDAYTDGIPF